MENSTLKIKLTKSSSTKAQTLVVFATKDKKTKKPVATKLATEIQKRLDAASAAGVFSGDRRETAFFREAQVDGFQHLLFIGLGEAGSVDAESLRVGGAIALGSLRAHKVQSAAIGFDSILKWQKNPAIAVEGLAEGFWLGIYEYTELKGKANKEKKEEKKNDKPAGLSEVEFAFVGAIPNAAAKALERAQILSECQNFARRLGDTPGNYMTPTILANEAVKAAKGTGLKVTVWDGARIKKENFGGLMSVAKGSHEDPRFIIMEYKGGPASKKPVCFVGKGLTFDTGGISIKPSQSMEEMKYDMCGGAAVIATMVAIARLKLKVNAIGLVPSTENMPGGSALKPGDVFFARNGKSVEVFNTDAEGRLILADALSYATEQKPAAIFDAATLTGAILIALGNTHTGVFTRNNKLWKTISDASQASGEWVWQLPLVDFHLEDTRGTHADLCNITGGRLAGSSTAAAFLGEFVDPDIPWAHFDIAGTAWNIASRFPYHPKKGASGIIVRTFVELAGHY